MRHNRRLATPLHHAIVIAVVVLAAALVLPRASLAQTANSADQLILWTGCSEFVQLTDAELDAWKSRGADGIACQMRHLREMGGTQDFTGDPQAGLAGSNYDLERQMRATNIVGRMRARGMKAYLAIYLVNYWNTATPLKDWFDDGSWSTVVLRKMAGVAAAAHTLGFAGLAFDQELYPQAGNVRTATWNWNYPGNTHSEAAVRAEARLRGQQLMSTLTASFPGIELMAYDVRMPETWGEFVEEKVNGKKSANVPRLDADFWDGLAGVPGYGAIRWMDASFYKGTDVGSWEPAFQYHYNKLFSYLSRRFSSWAYAAPRLYVSPFAWIDHGTCNCGYQAARTPAYVATQLAEFRKWGMGGEFADYAYAGLRGFDYTPYLPAMRAASTPGVVDSSPPTVAINAPRASAAPVATLALDGTTADNLAVRFVRWQNDRGGSGMAQLVWDVLGGDYNSGYSWRTRWSASIPVAAGQNRITVTAEDIKGLDTTQVVTFANGPVAAAAAAPATALQPRTTARRSAKPRCRRAGGTAASRRTCKEARRHAKARRNAKARRHAKAPKRHRQRRTHARPSRASHRSERA